MKTKFKQKLINSIRYLYIPILDTIVLSLCLYIGHPFSSNVNNEIKPFLGQFSIAHFLVFIIIYNLIMICRSAYGLTDHFLQIFRTKKLMQNITLSFLTMFAFHLSTRPYNFEPNRIFCVFFCLLFGISLERIIFDSLWFRFIPKRAVLKNTIIYGANKKGKQLAVTLEKNPTLGYYPVGFFDDHAFNDIKKRFLSNPLPVLGGTHELVYWISNKLIDEVFITNPRNFSSNSIDLKSMCKQFDIDYTCISNPVEFTLHDSRIKQMNVTPFIKKVEIRHLIVNQYVKRFFDLFFAIFILVGLFPLMVIIGFFIKINSSGSVIFKQKRVGLLGKEFTMYKFRTMHFNTPSYAVHPENLSDPRITKVGRFLRKTCLDELPQFWNVIKGDMSIIGPRPEMPFIVMTYKPAHRARLNIKPGITGLWQILGDRSFPIHDNTTFDMYYIEHNSFWLDISIVFETIIYAIKGFFSK